MESKCPTGKQGTIRISCACDSYEVPIARCRLESQLCTTIGITEARTSFFSIFQQPLLLSGLPLPPALLPCCFQHSLGSPKAWLVGCSVGWIGGEFVMPPSRPCRWVRQLKLMTFQATAALICLTIQFLGHFRSC